MRRTFYKVYLSLFYPNRIKVYEPNCYRGNQGAGNSTNAWYGILKLKCMRTIKGKHKAAYSPIGNLETYSPLPSRTLDQIDPFLFLNHHGPQHYAPHNNGLPFGPHPHRGMETVTFILDGDIMHKDTAGHESVITAGGVQWMTAGKGLLHAEVSSKRLF